MSGTCQLLSTLWDSLLFWLSHPLHFLLPVAGRESLSVYDTLMWVFLVSSLFCWVMSLITNNLSQVDRLWSVLPPIYSTVMSYYAVSTKGLEASSSMLVMSTVSWVWGLRLTFQFVKKGGYTLAGEDYRWRYVKESFSGHPFLYHLFNLFFVVIYQNILLFLLVLPQLAILPSSTSLTLLDLLTAGVHLGLVALETLSDRQQQEFQTRKYKAIGEGAELSGDNAAGFVRSGLFAHCRHPNFVCEVLLWWVFGLFSVPRLGVNATLVGALNLTALFTGSVDITEQISSKKYPEYAEYQKNVPAYIPSVRMITI